MPAGVEVVVADGFATIDFVDTSKKGPGLQALLEVGTPPGAIEKLSRSGPRVLYVVPEGNAREAGLLDEVSEVDTLQKPDTSSATNATGAVPPEFPSTRDLHAQVLRSGSYREFAVGGLVEAQGTGVANEGIEAQLGETVELVSEPLDAIIGTAEIPDGVPVPDPASVEGGPLPDGSLPVLDTSGEDVVPKAWPDGEPDDDWKRPELDAYAKAVKGIDTREFKNKDAVLAAITKAETL